MERGIEKMVSLQSPLDTKQSIGKNEIWHSEVLYDLTGVEPFRKRFLVLLLPYSKQFISQNVCPNPPLATLPLQIDLTLDLFFSQLLKGKGEF